MHVQHSLALAIGLLRGGLELFGVDLDLLFFLLVALDFLLVLLGGIAAGDHHRQLGQVLLVALGLVIGPLIGGLGLADRRFVLVQQRFVLGGAALVAEQRAHRGENRGHHRDARREVVAAVGRHVLDFVIVRAVNMKTVA